MGRSGGVTTGGLDFPKKGRQAGGGVPQASLSALCPSISCWHLLLSARLGVGGQGGWEEALRPLPGPRAGQRGRSGRGG